MAFGLFCSMVIAACGLARMRSTIYESRESKEEQISWSDLRMLHKERDHGRILLHKGHGLWGALRTPQQDDACNKGLTCKNCRVGGSCTPEKSVDCAPAPGAAGFWPEPPPAPRPMPRPAPKFPTAAATGVVAGGREPDMSEGATACGATNVAAAFARKPGGAVRRQPPLP
jgi:hypothetical protein